MHVGWYVPNDTKNKVWSHLMHACTNTGTKEAQRTKERLGLAGTVDHSEF